MVIYDSKVMLVIGDFFTLNHDKYKIDNIMNSKSNNDEK